MGRPWSNSQLRRLGDALRDDMVVPPGCPSYDEVALWYLDLTVDIQRRISSVDWSPLLGSSSPEISSRVKTIGTLRDKLRRSSLAQLHTIRDIAGVRFEADMSLNTQDAVVETIASLFESEADAVVKDMRSSDHYGYRAVHIELRYHTRAWRAEIQVRTDLQGQWANMYEVAADVLGREIRYGEPSAGEPMQAAVHGLRLISTGAISEVESILNQVGALELAVDDMRRFGAATKDLEFSQLALNTALGQAQPLRLSLSSQLQKMTESLEGMRKAGS